MSNKKIAIILAVEYIVIWLCLFIPAGTLAWAEGWIFWVSLVVWGYLLIGWLLKHDPDLLNERLKVFAPKLFQDRVFAALLFAVFFSSVIIMPLDAVRFRWSRMPVPLEAAGFAIFAVSLYLIFLVFKENPYAAATVNVQKERGQKVISTGLYAYVRHPLYSTAILYLLGTGFTLGSWIGVGVVAIYFVFFYFRAIIEERLLSEQLEGYKEYMSKVKYRFIPYIF